MIYIKKPLILFSAFILAASAAFTVFVFSVRSPDKVYEWCVSPNAEHLFPAVLDGDTVYKGYDVLYGADEGEKVIYLTFDAGYDKGTHEAILNVLRRLDVPAAFFFDGNMLRRFPDIVERAYRDGHLVCNHTWNHPDMTAYGEDKEGYLSQLTKWDELYESLTGAAANKLMRFPMGRFSERCLQYNKEAGYTAVFWSFAYYDYDEEAQPSRDEAIEKIMARIHPGAVMLLHSTSKTNALILEDVIERIRAEGYRFAPLSELIMENPSH